MQWQLLFTVFALAASVFATYMAWSARESARRAEHSEHRLAIMRGQVAGLESSVVALDASHRKLQGRVYADEYWRGKSEKQPELNIAAPVGPDGTSRDVCENWQLAKQDGPGSKAAQCSCAYCEAMREARRVQRAKLRSGVKT